MTLLRIFDKLFIKYVVNYILDYDFAQKDLVVSS